tara:strand:- start:167 stop:613 length:447 start_codon:yes stop_codon:yes gene_type:complete
MATVSEALASLGIREWVLRGEPKNEEEFNASFTKIDGVDKDGNQIHSNDPKSFGVTWEKISDEMKKIEDEAPMVELRKQRNVKLAETDWMTLSDSPTMSDEWKTYRQALRDLPAESKDVTFDKELRGLPSSRNGDLTLKNVTWPKKPE